MNEKVKVVPLSGQKFQLHKLPADVGSFILMRLMGEVARAQSANAAKAATAPAATEIEEQSQEQKPKPSPEERIRVLCFVVFSGDMAFDKFQFIQRHCMMVVRRLENLADQEMPMPIMNDAGQWAEAPMLKQISTDPALVMQLMIEVLVFNFADFFAESGTGETPKP